MPCLGRLRRWQTQSSTEEGTISEPFGKQCNPVPGPRLPLWEQLMRESNWSSVLHRMPLCLNSVCTQLQFNLVLLPESVSFCKLSPFKFMSKRITVRL